LEELVSADRQSVLAENQQLRAQLAAGEPFRQPKLLNEQQFKHQSKLLEL